MLGKFESSDKLNDASTENENIKDENDFLNHPTVEKIIEKFNGKLTI